MDLSTLSNDELQGLYAQPSQPPSASPLASVSNEDLMALHKQQTGTPQATLTASSDYDATDPTGMPAPTQAGAKGSQIALREMQKGIPVVGALGEDSPDVQQFEAAHPDLASSAQTIGGVTATLPLMGSLPYAMGLEGTLAERTGMTAASQGILSGADTYARKQVAGVPAAEAARAAGKDALISSGIGGASMLVHTLSGDRT